MATRRQQKRKTSSGSSEADAEELLKQDHRTVEELFSRFEAASGAEKSTLARKICNELQVHTLLEEEIFYPACREKNVESAALDEAQVEHDGAKVLIMEILQQEPTAEFYDAKVAVLQEYIKHHVGEEERSSGGIFTAARKAGVDMTAIGQRLMLRKRELLERVQEESLEPPQPRSLKVKFAIQSQPFKETELMASQYRDRDDRGRFTEEGGGQYGRGRDDNRRYSGRGQQSREQPRDEYGRFQDQDDRGGYRGASNDRERDEYGRFTSEDDGRYERSGGDDYRGGRSSGSRERDEEGRFMSDDNRGRRGDYYRGDDYRGDSQSRGQGGWFGDSEGHARAAEQRWNRSGSQGDDRDEDGRSRGGSRDRGHGGWFGDPEGHARAAEQRWSRSGSQGDDRDEDGRGRGGSRGRGHGGWFGDPEGHSRAAEQRWSRSDRDEDDDRGRSGGGERGWFGDSRGHSDASRRGWQNRR